MKKNLIYLISAIVLAVVALMLILSRTGSTFSRDKSDFAVDDTSNVTRIYMSDKNNNILDLVRKAPGVWTVNTKYAAHKFNVEMLLSTVLQLEVKSPVAKSARENIIRDLATTAVKVEIYQQKYRIDLFGLIRLFPHDKLTKVYYVGPATQDNRGTFMIMEHSDQPYIVYMPGLRGFVSTRFTPIEKYWRDYSIFRKAVPEIRSVKMEFPGIPAESFEVINNGNRRLSLISLADQKEIAAFDTIKLMNFLTGFRNINFEAIISDMEQSRKDSILSSQPFCVITLTDTTGKANRVVTFRKPTKALDEKGKPLPFDLDRLYALVNDGKDFTLAQYFALDKILRPKSYFLPQQNK